MFKKITAIAAFAMIPTLGACEMDVLGLDDFSDELEEAWSTHCCFETSASDIDYAEAGSSERGKARMEAEQRERD